MAIYVDRRASSLAPSPPCGAGVTSSARSRSWAYPLPSVVAAAGWLAILVTSGIWHVAAGVSLLAVGVLCYSWRARQRAEWPSAPRVG